MIVTALIPLAVAMLGVLIYALASNPKSVEIGRILFFVGAFWLVAILAHRDFRF